MTFGLGPKAYQVFQNWCSLTPTGRFGATIGTCVTFWQNSSDRHRKHLSHILNSDLEQYLELCLSFVTAHLQYMDHLQ